MRVKSFSKFCESISRESNLKQLMKVVNMSKSTDIGLRTKDVYKGVNNVSYVKELDKVDTYEDWLKMSKDFKPGWNARGEVSPFS